MKRLLFTLLAMLMLSACNKTIRTSSRYLLLDGTNKNTMIEQLDSTALSGLVRPYSIYDALYFKLSFISDRKHTPEYSRSLAGISDHFGANSVNRNGEIDTLVSKVCRETKGMIADYAVPSENSHVFYAITKLLNEAYARGADETDIYVCSDLLNNTSEFSAYKTKDLKMLFDYERMSEFMNQLYPLQTNASIVRLHFLYAPENSAQDKSYDQVFQFLTKFYQSHNIEVHAYSSFHSLKNII